MSTTTYQRKLKLMRVSLYRVESARSPSMLRRHGEDANALRLKLRCLSRDEVFGDSEQAAAAKVWRDAVGTWRLERLRELNAPEPVIALELEYSKDLESHLVSSSLLAGVGYMLDNGTETWLITVDWDWKETRNLNPKREEKPPNA